MAAKTVSRGSQTSTIDLNDTEQDSCDDHHRLSPQKRPASAAPNAGEPSKKKPRFVPAAAAAASGRRRRNCLNNRRRRRRDEPCTSSDALAEDFEDEEDEEENEEEAEREAWTEDDDVEVDDTELVMLVDRDRRKIDFNDVEDDDDDDDDGDDDDDDEEEEDTPPGDRVAYIHVGEGGEADLEAQLKGAENLDIQILEEENLPDIDESDMIHGLDHTGTARDYVDERHRCTANCPVGCQGHLRPNEIVIYESFKWKGKLRGRRR